MHWDVQSDDAIVSQRIEFSPDGHYQDRFTVLVDDLPASARSCELTIPLPGFAVTNQPQFIRVVAVDAGGQEAWDQVPVLVPSGNLTGSLSITTDLSGRVFYAGQSIPDIQWTGSVGGFPTINPLVVLESDGAAILGHNSGGGQGTFFQKFPYVSTDRARLAIQARNNSNDVAWFFADGYFSIRHDPRLDFQPPSVTLLTPTGGEELGGGTTVHIAWIVTAPEGQRSCDLQASYDAGRTWHPIVRDLPAGVSSYDWRLPASMGIPDVRLRVIARDLRFQNSSAGSGPFAVTAGTGSLPGDLNGDGYVDLIDFATFSSCFVGSGVTAPPAGCSSEAFDRSDLDGDGDVDLSDFGTFSVNFAR